MISILHLTRTARLSWRTRPDKAPGRVDYDQLAPWYDRRFEAGQLAGVLATLQRLLEDVAARRILEVGCGTGRWLADLEGEGIHRWGLDP